MRSAYTSPSVLPNDLDVAGLGALLPLGRLELDARALGERLEALAVDRAEVYEDVLAAFVRGDEPVSLRVVEPLHDSGCHMKTPPSAEALNGQEARRTRDRCSLVVPVRGQHSDNPRLMQLLAAPDKFRGTLTAHEAASAMAVGAELAGWTAVELPLADGGEGTLDVLGGGNRRTTVSGPLAEPVDAAWRLEEDGTALIEAAQACGLTLAGGPEGNDPLRATSRGVGELIATAVAEGARRIVVWVGGVASTDGGLGATEALPHPLRVPLEVACDVDARFLD